MRPLRILQVVTLSERGGAQRHLADLIGGLSARGHEVHLATSAGDYLISEAERRGAAVHLQPHLRRDVSPSHEVRALVGMVRLIRALRPDLVHAHSSKAGVLARIAARISGAPSVYTAHGLVFLEPLPLARRAFYLALELVGGRSGDRVIAVSTRDADAVRRFRLTRPGSVVVIPNGIDAGPEPMPAPDPSPVRFAVVANAYPTKGLDVLVQALGDPRLRFADIEVEIAGAGPDLGAIKAAARGMPVRFLGRIDGVGDLLARSHVLVQPSRKEGWPYSVLEAMAAERPAIVTNVGGMPDQIDHGRCGWVVAPGDAGSLAEAMAEAARDPEGAAARGKAARERVVRSFTVDAMIAKVERQYEAVLERREEIGTVPGSSSRDKPRIVLLSPSPSRGMSHYAHALAEAMEAAADVVVLDGARDGGTVRLWRRLRALTSNRHTRVINTSPHWSTPFLIRAPGVRGGHVLHDPILNAATRLTRPLHVAYYRMLTRRLGVVIVHAERFAPLVSDLRLPAREIVVVPHGFVPHQMVSVGDYDPAGPMVLVGRLLPYKGFDVLVCALEILRDRGLDMPVIVGGEGVTPALARADLPNLELRYGLIEDDEFADLIRRCSAVLLPYRVATQSGVLATAFSAGRPVIASAMGSFPDYVSEGENGMLIPSGDPWVLADAMARFRGDPHAATAMAARARRTWEERLSPQRCAQMIVEALERDSL